MRIGIDVDGVIADNHTAWLNRYNHAHEDANFTPDDLTQWEFWHDLLPGCDWAELKSYWTPDIYGEVLPFPGAKEAIEAIRAMGHEVHFITSCTKGFDEFNAKLMWLEKHGFATLAPGYYVWGVGPEFIWKSKEHVAEVNKIDWLVDDHIPHVEAWPGHSILMTRPHNQRLNCTRKRVKSLSEVVTLLKYHPPRVGDVLMVTHSEKAPAGHTISREKLMGNAFDADGIQAIESKVLDFAGKVDGGGVKGSQTDDSKLPMWLVPIGFYEAVRHPVVDVWRNATADVDPIATVAQWVDGGDSRVLLKLAAQELAVQLGGGAAALRAVAKVLQYGAKKYAANNWRRGMKWSDVSSAGLRHMVAAEEGEALDAESGLPHLAHAACCVAFLLEYTEHPQLYAQFDDRFKRPVAVVA